MKLYRHDGSRDSKGCALALRIYALAYWTASPRKFEESSSKVVPVIYGVVDNVSKQKNERS